MKIVLILFVAGLLATCQTTYLNGYDVSPPNHENPVPDLPSDMPRIRVKAENTYSVFDLVSFDGALVGVGVGIQNKSNTIFEYDGDLSIWSQRILRLSRGEINLWSVKSLAIVGNTIMAGLANGEIWRADSLSDRWQLVGKVDSAPSKIVFADERVGYVIGETFGGCRIFKTEDGGANWNVVFESVSSGNCFDLEIVSKDVIVAATNNEYLLRSEDAGSSWHFCEIEPTGLDIDYGDWIKLDKNGAVDLQTSPKGNLWVVGEKGSIYMSANDGESWTRPARLPESVFEKRFNSIAFSDVGTGLAVADEGYVIVTYDFGKSWSEFKSEDFLFADGTGTTNKSRDDLRRVLFRSNEFVILGKRGFYAVDVKRK